MEFLTELWLPILLSAVFVFLVSSIFHVALPFHKGECRQIPGEDNVLKEMRTQGVHPGDYGFPSAPTMKEMASPEMIEKYRQGPVGFMTVLPSGPPAMGKRLTQWFLYSVLVGVFAAYVGMLALSPGAAFVQVFRVTGTVAVLGYALGHMHNSIWKGQCWGTTCLYIFDGVIYGLVTAATFGWLWPCAA